MKNIFSFLFKLIVGFISLLIAALAFCIIFGVTVDLSFLKPGVEKAAESALGREVKINGPVVFEFSHWTAIDIRDVHVANVPNATNPDFFTAGLARLELGLMPLLKGEIHISEIIAEDVILNLESDAKGEPNWVFDEQASQKEVKENLTKDPAKASPRKKITFAGLDKLSLKRIALTYHDQAIKKTFKSQLDSMSGEMSLGKPILFTMDGHINKTLYNMKLKGDPFDNLRIKDKPWAFKLEGRIASKEIAAKGDLLRTQAPVINMAFGVKDVDVGAILSALGLVKGMSASMGNAGIKVSIRGKSLQQILRESDMAFIVKDANWKVVLPNSKESFDISGLNGDIYVKQGNNLTMDLTGKIKEEPVKLRITGSPLVKYIETPDEIPLTIDAELAKMKLSFSSILTLPLTTKDLKLALKLSGERLDSINRLFKLDLPPYGPLALDAQMHVTDKGYDLSKLHMKVGQTTLDGKMNLDVSQKRPNLDLELISDMIQINDFTDKKKKVKKKKEQEEKQTVLSEAEKKKIRKLLSAEVLGLANAKIIIKAKQVMSGKDKLGSGSAKVTLKNARLAVEPLLINVPGGGIRIDFSYFPRKNTAVIDLKAKIDKFDLGVIARRAKPGTDMGGTLYLDAKLHSETANLKEMMKNAKGHFDFGLVPKNFSSDVIDLWAVNLVSALMDKETEKDKSVVNCFIMRFDMQEGFMQERIVYMDTTHMRVAGTAEVNFKTEKINMMMAPEAKTPEFFSLATPIQIKGNFKDFGLKLSGGHLFATVISFITSPIHVPIRRILVDEIPADGIDDCRKAWYYIEKKAIKKKSSKTQIKDHEDRLDILDVP